MRINNNITASNSHRQLNINTNRQSQTVEQLSSGLRINRSADDAAGLAISEKMRTQIRGLSQASRNTQDGISLVQTADGGMQTITDMLQRKRELVVQALNGTNEEIDRDAIQLELDHLMQEIHDTATTLDFNGLNVLSRAEGSTHQFEPLVPSAFPTGTVLLGGTPPPGGRPTSAGGSLSTQVTNPNTGELFGLVDFTDRFSDGWQHGDSMDVNIRLNFNVPARNIPLGGAPPRWRHEFDFPNEITITTPPHHQTGISETLTYAWDGVSGFALVTSPTEALRHFEFPEFLPAHANITTYSSTHPGQSISIPISGEFHHIGSPMPNRIDESLNNSNLRDFDGVWSFEVTFDEPIGNPARMDSFNFSQEATMHLEPHEPIWIQSGANQGVGLNITGVDARPHSLGLRDIWGDTLVVTDPHQEAEEALVLLTEAINEVSLMRAEMGAQNNRLEHTHANVNNTRENLSAAESRIRDADMAERMTVFTRDSILTQASTAMLAQANALPQTVLQLLG